MPTNEITLGQLVDGDAQRDAIHIAVAPVVAAEPLLPGDHVGMLPDGRCGENAEVRIGIVDPFLKEGVRAGQRFWLCLYPNTVTSLRHQWTHPAFPEPALPTMAAVLAGERGAGMSDKQYSEEWLRRYAERMNCYDADPEQAYQRLLQGLRTKELFSYGGDLHGLHDLYDAEELRHHAEVVLGKSIDFSEFSFRCSC